MESGKSEMKEIKVRIWGSGVGIGSTHRKIALVPAGFMAVRDPNQSQKTSGKASTPKKRKHSDQQDEKESVPDTVMDDEQSSTDVLIAIDFDSETGVGTRPEISLLRLPRHASNGQDTASLAELTYAAENRTDTSSSNGIKNEKMETTSSSSSSSSTRGDTLDRFWKSIEDGNYFLPFSTRSHHLEDLCIRGGDYAELSAIPPLGNTAETFASSGNNALAIHGTNGAMAGIITDSTVLNGHNVPLSSHDGTKQSNSQPSNTSFTEMTDEKMSSSDDITNILYERLLLSIVKPEDTIKMEPINGSGMISSSSQENIIDEKEIATDGNGKKRKIVGTKEKKSTAKGRKSKEKGGDDNDKDINGHVHNGDSEVDSVSMSSGTFLSIKSDSMDFDAVEAAVSGTTTLLNCGLHGIGIASIDSTQNCNSNSFNKRKNGITTNVALTNGLSATTTNIAPTSSSFSLSLPSVASSSSSSVPNVSSSSSSSSNLMKTFGRGHRTLVELAEFGLINGGNIQGLDLNPNHNNDRYNHNSDILRLSPKGITASGTSATSDSAGLSDRNNNKHDISIHTVYHGSNICGYLKEQMTTYWTDDEISISHRETVKLLEETEKQLNERIVNLRQFMSHPEVHQEESHRKRQNELNRSVIGRLGKYRKKERQQAQLAHKVQQRQKSREKKGGGLSESGGES